MKLEYWRYARCEYTKLELKFHIFWKIQNFLKNFDFRSFFRTLKSKKSLFFDIGCPGEISEKIENFRKSRLRGRTSCGNHPKPVFWSLGGPCDQNEAYTSLVRPFLKKLWAREVGAFLADFPEIPFWPVCGYVISPKGNIIF